MQTLILNHYPPVLKQIKEIQQITKAEDIEFTKLNSSINEVICNMSVFTANETGVQQFEKLLGIKPKAAQSLEDRKIYIMSVMNGREMSVSEIEALLSQYCKSIELLYDTYTEEVTVKIEESTISIDMMNSILEEILPVNVYYRFLTKVRKTAQNKIIIAQKIGAQLKIKACLKNHKT